MRWEEKGEAGMERGKEEDKGEMEKEKERNIQSKM